MQAQSVTPNLIQLTKFGLVNAYLVREDDGFTLVDTAMRAADEIIAAATEAGAEIKRILITHAHTDHVGSVDALVAKLGRDLPVLISETDGKLLAGEPVDFGPGGKQRGGFSKLSIRPGTVAVGETIGHLEAVAAPGHTPGQLAFRDTRDNSLIAGDAYHTVGGDAHVPSHFSLPFPFPALATCNRPQALETAKALRALDPSVLVVGHGRPLTTPAASMDRAITAAGG